MSLSDYLLFSALFIVIHTIAYNVAGLIALRIARDVYEGRQALLAPLMRDVSDPAEGRRIGLLLFPAQFVRGLLMSLVLYPVLEPLGDLSFVLRFAFFAGLMFVYADVASAIPFSNTIEGLIYLKKRFVEWSTFLRIQAEAVIYSVLFGLAAAWLLL